MVEQCPADDADTEINLGCLLYKVRNTTIGCREKDMRLTLTLTNFLVKSRHCCHVKLQQCIKTLISQSTVPRRCQQNEPPLGLKNFFIANTICYRWQLKKIIVFIMLNFYIVCPPGNALTILHVCSIYKKKSVRVVPQQSPMALGAQLLLLSDQKIVLFSYKSYAGHPIFYRFRALGSTLQVSLKQPHVSQNIFPTSSHKLCLYNHG